MQSNLKFVRTSLQSLLIKAGICDQVVLEARIVLGNWDFLDLIGKQSISRNEISMVEATHHVSKSQANLGTCGSRLKKSPADFIPDLMNSMNSAGTPIPGMCFRYWVTT